MNAPGKSALFILLLLLALAALTARYGSRNYAYLLLSKGYAGATADEQQTLRRAWRLACAASPSPACAQPDAPFLPLLDDYYLDQAAPLHVVTDTLQLAAADLHLGDQFVLNQVTGNHITLFGEGSLEARLFLMTEAAAEWTISVTARHDAPPPVDLAVWVDGVPFGTLSFAKGDGSWETLSLTGKITPRLHGLSLWFVNDYRDAAAGLDRNAYVEQIMITRSGTR